ncbi:hypothetical protein GGI10_005444, partial [Coemansia sp. RSA 2530]
ERDLQDPVDKRYILCDDKLLVLFHESRLYMYTMNKLLNEHFIKPTPEENAEAIALLGLPPSQSADGADVAASTSVKAEGSTHSPAPSDGDTQHTGDEEEEDEEDEEEDDDEHDVKEEAQPTSASTAVDSKPSLPKSLSPSAAISSGTSAPLVLPPMPSNINGAGSSGI